MPEAFGSQRGQTGNSGEDALGQLRWLTQFLKGVYTWDFAVVTRYDHVAGVVDVRAKLDSGGLDIRNVPIWGRGGTKARFGWPLQPAHFDAVRPNLITNSPDVGMLFYPRLDSSRALEDFQLRGRGHTDKTHGALQPIFFPGIPVAIQALIANTHIDPDYATGNKVFTPVLFHEVGPDDSFFLTPNGAGLVVKGETDKVLLRGNEVVFLGLNQKYEDAQAVARQGDAGDGLGGSIAGGSSVVRAG